VPIDRSDELVVPLVDLCVKNNDFAAKSLEFPWSLRDWHHITLHTAAGFG
jgi:hypothetical protein